MNKRDRLAGDIRKVLTDAVGPDRYAKPDEFTAIGVPERHAQTLSRESKQLETRDDIDDLVDDWADRITQLHDNSRELGPAELARTVPRF